MNHETVLKKIAALEQELKQLKLEVNKATKEGEVHTNTKRKPRVGDRVKILNPRKGQEPEGTVSRIGTDTKFVTVETKKGKVIRHLSNIGSLEND
jgi:hypothetical protein